MIFEREKALRLERQPRKSGGPRQVHIFRCTEKDCEEEIRIRSSDLKNHSGLCQSHSQRKRPFESIYNGLYTDHRHLEIKLTYEEFLEFTKIKKCHYCYNPINWVEYGCVNSKFTSRARYLDRKNNDFGYSKENCVVCCTLCNRTRSARYTYEDWFGMTEYFRKLRT
jgi:hypothetical protein